MVRLTAITHCNEIKFYFCHTSRTNTNGNILQGNCIFVTQPVDVHVNLNGKRSNESFMFIILLYMSLTFLRLGKAVFMAVFVKQNGKDVLDCEVNKNSKLYDVFYDDPHNNK